MSVSDLSLDQPGQESEVVGVAFSVPEPPFTEEMLVAVVNERADGRARAIEEHLREAFRIHCGHDDWTAWKSSRFAVTVGDQALAPGGPANKAQSLGLRLLWEGLQRPRRDVADAFHLINRAGKFALKEGAAIATFFAMLKKLEHLFGLGHGRHVDRCVAAFLGVPQLACRSPAGHRKTGRASSTVAVEESISSRRRRVCAPRLRRLRRVQATGYLCGVPERFLQKFENFFYDFLVRERQAADGRGTYSFARLQQLHGEMCDQSTVALALGLVSGMQHNLAGASLRSQDIGDLPWTRWRALKKAQQGLAGECDVLRWWRERLIVLALLEAYLEGPEDLVRWWRSLCLSPQGRRVCCPATGIHMGWSWYEILFYSSYKGCTLHAATTPLPSRSAMVHPACQCFSRPQRQPGTDNLRRGGGLMTDPSLVYWAADHAAAAPAAAEAAAAPDAPAARAVRAPWWVSKAAYSRKKMLESAWGGPSSCLPRWQVWLHTLGESVDEACRVPLRARESMDRIDTAVCHLQRFWKAFAEAFEEVCLGDVGVSREMQEIQQAMSVCWWLPDIVAEPLPSPRHEMAVLALYERVLPDLRARPWPPADYRVTQAWPNRRGVVVFFRRWWAAIHKAAAANEFPSWRRVSQYLVEPVDWPGGASAAFRVRARDLRYSSAAGSAKPPAATVAAGAGTTATLRCGRLRGRRVRVLEAEYEIDQRAIAATLEHSRRFAEGQYYHINDMFCVTRRFGSTEASCERWIGAMKRSRQS